MPAMQPISNKETIKRLHDAFNSGDGERISAAIAELVEPDVVISTPLPVDATGAQALEEVFVRLLRAFPDLHIEVEDVIAESDKCTAHSPSRSKSSATGGHR
ncbi:nuclear transport factor 2 family protein [Kribbella sp. NPDC050241]|uniref:nuclear transport factor 2 family protein n=1 Tax=Kribbella sp. NPDC050241 TaxID=3364115 RepID=UPI0037B65CB9